MKTIYVSQKDNRSWSSSPSSFGGLNYPAVVPDGFTGGAMTHNRFTDEWVTDPAYVRTHADDVNDAEAVRNQLKAEAEEIISGWVLDLNLGLISDEDKQKLIAWRLYVKALDAIELEVAPDIEWPPRPEN
ncbi:tail fiber assembly protein [Kluyvera cryocrescens]|uniref:tail fiber assembly protein n=1 Tax=Kluyvera cryocrescens TaxID=580 RepID=UPI002DB5CE6A|nr:tail fiber assembly protein [Kluyvera cryocrescens]MEB7711833.1 tail fiber assembly protein [Kluyvera cryocrescens]